MQRNIDVLYIEPNKLPVKKTIKNVMQNSTNYDKIIIVVGPEGGFTTKEEDYLLLYLRLF